MPMDSAISAPLRNARIARPLRESLGVVADHLDAYQTDKWVRVMWLTGKVDCNWKIIHDNFNEAYHVLSLHRELGTFIDDAYQNTDYDIYETGHNRMRMKGCLPSSSSRFVRGDDQVICLTRSGTCD